VNGHGDFTAILAQKSKHEKVRSEDPIIVEKIEGNPRIR
jgi:hypothetical protein